MKPFLLACLVACGASQNQGKSAPDPLADLAATYAHAKTYTDSGTVTILYTKGAQQHVSKKTFQTAFVRGDRFRFEFRDADDPTSAYVVWSDGRHAYTRWRDQLGDNGELGIAIANATGVSGGAAHAIPRLLVPEIGGSSFVQLLAPTTELATLDGHPVVHVSGRRTDPIDIWIDRRTHLVRRIVERHHFDDFDAQMTTDYEAEIDREVAADRLQPPDLTRPAQPAWIGIRADKGSARVMTVVHDAPAERGGIQLGDEIVSIDGNAIATGPDITSHTRALECGKPVPFVVRRDGAERTLTVVPEHRPDADKIQRSLVGKPAPDFTVASLNGTPVRLADLRGHVVILEFWATWCGPCEITAPYLDEWYARHGKRGLRVIGISEEHADELKKYVAEHQLGYTFASDPTNAIGGSYLVQGLPTLVVVDKAGIVRVSQIGMPDDFPALEATIKKLL